MILFTPKKHANRYRGACSRHVCIEGALADMLLKLVRFLLTVTTACPIGPGAGCLGSPEGNVALSV